MRAGVGITSISFVDLIFLAIRFNLESDGAKQCLKISPKVYKAEPEDCTTPLEAICEGANIKIYCLGNP